MLVDLLPRRMFRFSDVLVARRPITAQGAVRRRIGSRIRRAVPRPLEACKLNTISLTMELPSTFVSVYWYGPSCS